MIEIKSKHTFILTIDNATAEATRLDDSLLAKLRVVVMQHGMTFADGKVVRDGVYFKKVVMG